MQRIIQDIRAVFRRSARLVSGRQWGLHLQNASRSCFSIAGLATVSSASGALFALPWTLGDGSKVQCSVVHAMQMLSRPACLALFGSMVISARQAPLVQGKAAGAPLSAPAIDTQGTPIGRCVRMSGYQWWWSAAARGAADRQGAGGPRSACTGTARHRTPPRSSPNQRQVHGHGMAACC